MDKKTHHKNPAINLVWVDLEMTGLNPEHDRIIEIATIITDSELNVIEEGPVMAIHQEESFLNGMDDWNKTCHTGSGLVEKVRKSKISEEKAEEKTLEFIAKYCPKGTSPLCGNSIEHDRRFIIKYMPELDKYLHFRHINVSTVKELVLRWYADDPHAEFKKKQTHQALPDIRESIEELKHYRKYFFTEKTPSATVKRNSEGGL